VKQHVRIYLLGLMALFFISTTGVTVYKHYCSHGGEFYGVFMDVSHDCQPEKTIEDSHACCDSGDNKSDFKFTEECCTSDVDFYQIDTDLIHHDTEVEFVAFFVPATSFALIAEYPEFKKIATANKAPPFLTTSKRLSLFQMYLI